MIKDYGRFAATVLLITLAGFAMFMAAERAGLCFNEEGRDTDEFGMKCIGSTSFSAIAILLLQLMAFPAVAYFIGIYFYFGGKRPQAVDFIVQLSLLTAASAIFELFFDTAVSRLVLNEAVVQADIPMSLYLLAVVLIFVLWTIKNAIPAAIGGLAAYFASRK
ncbi:MAG: hypothetical protein AB1529_03385 [Candidatus Micrarchaeota archaeon]